MELVLPEAGADLAATSFDLQMFVGTRGRERTLAEWQRQFGRSEVSLELTFRTHLRRIFRIILAD